MAQAGQVTLGTARLLARNPLPRLHPFQSVRGRKVLEKGEHPFCGRALPQRHGWASGRWLGWQWERDQLENTALLRRAGSAEAERKGQRYRVRSWAWVPSALHTAAAHWVTEGA
ncbi:hypothetical protein KIL84_020140 [Mauremys mutica]|uniref:Uncharacterized protein n=1 Tax=Mauremys mutica TaxID=74926 RepID=A0A9D3XW55_9SAUR|nr:hypothetical protein KIL84_020140 [Mauremys mutica]